MSSVALRSERPEPEGGLLSDGKTLESFGQEVVSTEVVIADLCVGGGNMNIGFVRVFGSLESLL